MECHEGGRQLERLTRLFDVENRFICKVLADSSLSPDQKQELIGHIQDRFDLLGGDLPDGIDDIDPEDDWQLGMLVRKLGPKPHGTSGIALPLD
jgi:hypothetical protein